MSAIFYLYRRIFSNRVRKALCKPITYFYIAFFVFYGTLLPSFGKILSEVELDSPFGMTALFTAFALWAIPANIIAFAKRKGLLFRNSDVNFLFTSPISPKKILLYSYLKTLITSTFLEILLIIFCTLIFRVAWWVMILYFFFSIVIQNLLEGSMMMLLYGTERMGEKGRAAVVKGAYALVGVLVIIGFYTYSVYGMSLGSVIMFLHSDAVQMVPIIGWYVAVIHLLFMGPTTVNVICSSIYAVFLVLVLWSALRMRCTGGYYEDAIKFADDYEDIIYKSKKGEVNAKRIGAKKKTFGKANIVYKGGLSKAIFYRQMLEYKKDKYFIFDFNTIVNLILGCGIAYLFKVESELGIPGEFVMLGAMAYITLIFTSLNGKWGKEIMSPYTFLIPDSAFSKLWYATLIQHIQAVFNACLMVFPGAVIMKFSPLTTILCIVSYVILNASKLYILAVSQVIVGDVLGLVGRQMLQILLQGVVIGIAALGVVAGYFLINMDMAFVLMILLLIAETLLLMLIASKGFYRMETA